MDQHSADAAAQRLLLANHGAARVSELYGIGLSKDQVAQRVRKGVFVRHGHGVIGLAGVDDSLLSRAMRAVLISGEGSAVSLWTAAELHRLDAPHDDVMHVVRAGPTRRSDRPGIVLHRTRRLPADHIVMISSVPTTSIDRTLVDCARLLDTWLALRMLDSLSAGRRLWERIHRTASALANGRAGVRAIADATAPDGAERFRSALERRAADALAARGIDGGEWNVTVRDERGRIREVDLCFREARVIVEFDGLRHHSSAASAGRDRATDRRLQLAGWRVLRFTWRDVVHRTDAMVAEIAEALTAF